SEWGYYMCYQAGTSAASLPTSYANTPAYTSLTDGTAVFEGNNVSMSYLFHGSSLYSTITTTLGTGTIHDNYVDARGAYGVFYPNSFSAGPWPTMWT